MKMNGHVPVDMSRAAWASTRGSGRRAERARLSWAVPPRPIYLDHNATTPIHPAARAAMLPWLETRWGNPSSGHAYGREAAAAVATARAQVAGLIGARPEELVFTSGGTEADNLALLGVQVAEDSLGRAPRVALTAVEHPAVAEAAGALARRGWEVVILPVTRAGRVDLAAAAELLARPVDLLSAIAAQNETGVLQPVAELAALARAANPAALVHCDAAQAVGKISVDVRALAVDLLTVVSHKLYGPAGVGALYVREGLSLRPWTLGGGQERGLRSGTEPVLLLAGFGAACAAARSDLGDASARQSALREALWQRLAAAVPGLQRTGEGVETLPNTLHVRFPGTSGAEVLARAPAVAASTGSACHGDDHVSGALAAMGLRAAEARGAVRLSLGRGTTAEDVAAAADALAQAWRG